MPVCRKCRCEFDELGEFIDHLLLSKCLDSLREERGVKFVWISHYDQLKAASKVEKELEQILNDPFFNRKVDQEMMME